MNMPAKQQKNIQSGLVPICTAILVPNTTNTADTNAHRWSSKDKTAEVCGYKGSKSLTSGEGVTAVVKQLPQWRAAVSAPGLLAVDGVQGLVNKQADSTQQVRPEGSLEQQQRCPVRGHSYQTKRHQTDSSSTQKLIKIPGSGSTSADRVSLR